MSVLELKNISKKYPGQEKPAVKDLTFSLQDNEIITLLGPSGCGKTTILRMIAGFVKPNRGKIYLKNELVAGEGHMKPPEKREVGMMFQDYALFPHLNVKENIIFGLEKKLNREEQDKRVKELLKLVGMKGYQNKYPHELSGGQKQRVALSRALSREPAVILMDEPFSSLDERMREEMRKEIKNILHQSNTPAIIVSHDREDAFSLSDRLAVMKAGKIEQTGTPQKIFAKPQNKFVADFASRSNLFQLSAIENKENGEVCGYCQLGEISPLPEGCLKNEIESEQSLLAIRPDAFEIDPQGDITAKVVDYIYYGSYVEAHLSVNSSCESIEIKAHFDQIPGEIGSEISLSFRSQNCWIIN